MLECQGYRPRSAKQLTGKQCTI